MNTIRKLTTMKLQNSNRPSAEQSDKSKDCGDRDMQSSIKRRRVRKWSNRNTLYENQLADVQ